MTPTYLTKLCAILAAAALCATTTQAYAMPAGGAGHAFDTPSQGAQLLEHVQHRGQFQGRGYRGNRRGNNRNLGLAIGGLIIGGVILSEAARSEHRRQHRSAWQRCADTYRSFESDTGMYTGYDGERHTCPYLR